MKKVVFLLMGYFLLGMGSANAALVYTVHHPQESKWVPVLGGFWYTLGAFDFDISISGTLDSPGTVTTSTTYNPFPLATGAGGTGSAANPSLTGGWYSAAQGAAGVDAPQTATTSGGNVQWLTGGFYTGFVYTAAALGTTATTFANDFVFDPVTGTGTFQLDPFGATADYTWTFAAPAPVPVPAAAWLFATGLAGLVARAKKQKK